MTGVTPGFGILISIGIAITICIAFSICPPGQDKNLMRLLVVTTVVCLWFTWFIVYISQMNPIIQPMIATASED